MLQSVRGFISSASAGGVALAIAALLALLASNSPWSSAYERFVQWPVELRVGDWTVLAKPLLVWVNDLWMAVFFFAVGLEIKRELLAGELSSRRQAMLPAAAALAGMVLPALIYVAINHGDPIALRGWAVPTATDIAFSLGIVALLGTRVPAALKVFLTAVAIIDDLGAIVVIALFYTAELSWSMLGAAAVAAVTLTLFNRAGVVRLGPYLTVGLVMWLCVLKSGLHPTLAGVATALAVPLHGANGHSPLEHAEHALRPWVAFLVLPVFAFVNAGVVLQGIGADTVLRALPLGIVAGLVVGKAVGVFGASWLMVRYAGARWPRGASQLQCFGVSALCGVGFTMSLFIGTLAFEGRGDLLMTELKIGVLGGSLLAVLTGTAVLLVAARRQQSVAV